MELTKLEKTIIGYHLLAIDLEKTKEAKNTKAEELFETIARWKHESYRSGELDGSIKELKEQLKKFENEQD